MRFLRPFAALRQIWPVVPVQKVSGDTRRESKPDTAEQPECIRQTAREKFDIIFRECNGPMGNSAGLERLAKREDAEFDELAASQELDAWQKNMISWMQERRDQVRRDLADIAQLSGQADAEKKT